MSNPIRNAIADFTLGQIAAPRVPTPTIDSPRINIDYRQYPFGYGTSQATASASSYTSSGGSGPGTYKGPLDVMGMTQSVENQFVGAGRALSGAMSTVGLSSFMGIGSAMSMANLQRIENKIAEGEAGYALGMFNNRIIGVSPGLFGGYTLSGVLPEGLTPQQRNQLTSNLLSLREAQDNPKDFAVTPQPTPEPTDEERAASGRANIVFDDKGQPVKVGNTDDYVTTASGQYVSQAELQRQNQAKQAADAEAARQERARAAEAARAQAAAEAAQRERDDNDNNQPRNEYSIGSGGSSNPADRGYSMRAKGGPVQKTGFVEGSPDNYAKGDTVADTVKTQVREGSFVLNAPTVEKLQQAGMLPKGVDNSDKNATIKAKKGGLMDVALSKGEYVIEPEEAQRIGYSFLEKINDQGKPEVDRRQAAADGGAIDGYSNGGNTGMLRYAGPLSAIELMKSGLSVTTPEGFIGGPTTYDGPYPSSETDAPPAPIPPLLINGIDIAKVGKGLSYVEIRGYENKNDGYIYTKSGTPSDPSSAFGPLQLTHTTVKAMLQKPDRKKKIKGGSAQLLLEMKRDPEFGQYVVDFEQDLRNRANVIQYNEIHTGGGFFNPGEQSTKRRPTAEEKQLYKNLGTGAIPLERHKQHYPTLANLYLAYKAEMSDSEEDMVKRHFGNTKSTAKYFEALEELGLDK